VIRNTNVKACEASDFKLANHSPSILAATIIEKESGAEGMALIKLFIAPAEPQLKHRGFHNFDGFQINSAATPPRVLDQPFFSLRQTLFLKRRKESRWRHKITF
jgi:hypothetical protein